MKDVLTAEWKKGEEKMSASVSRVIKDTVECRYIT